MDRHAAAQPSQADDLTRLDPKPLTYGALDEEGIAAEQLPHIFTPYWQARKGDRAGIGLGLAIARGIVEAHGGAISVESGAGGTTFTLSLPVAHGGLAAV